MHFEGYLSIVEENTPGVAASIKPSIETFVSDHIETFDCMSRSTGLLYGQVQSGKTGQMLGAIAAAADEGFKLFVLLTTDNIRLQEQTLQRALETLDTFNICGENDDMRFRTGSLRRPTVVVLKKNQSVLRRWHDIIASSGFCEENPIFIVDDEADSASLNTRINQAEQSTINSLLQGVISLSHVSIYLQVTATPQSILLQRYTSDFRPDFTHYFEPGNCYLGGNYFYSEDSTCIRPTDDSERAALLRTDNVLPEGIRKAFWAFFIAAAHITLIEKKTVCNFLIHPGLRTHEHDTIEHKINLLLLKIKQDLEINAGIVFDELRDAWTDLSYTKPDLIDFETLKSELTNLLDQINVIVINSESSTTSSYKSGLNIVIGGNSLGRGLTLPGLHTVYYCRTAQTPQADTCWQHSRIFGYDRDGDLCRIFLPPVLLRLFRELDEANDAVTGLIVNGGDIENYSILSPRGTRPTRPSVIEVGTFDIWYGGTNYFPNLPVSANLQEIDVLLGNDNTIREVDLDFASQVVGLIEVENGDSWVREQVITHISTLRESGYDSGCQLVIRVNRDVGKGTGTLLSPDDRALTHNPQNRDRLVLVMYRLNGTVDKGWEGSPLWVPNIKFPVGANYIYTL